MSSVYELGMDIIERQLKSSVSACSYVFVFIHVCVAQANKIDGGCRGTLSRFGGHKICASGEPTSSSIIVPRIEVLRCIYCCKDEDRVTVCNYRHRNLFDRV